MAGPTGAPGCEAACAAATSASEGAAAVTSLAQVAQPARHGADTLISLWPAHAANYCIVLKLLSATKGWTAQPDAHMRLCCKLA